MAHVGEEFALGGRRLLGPPLGDLELPLRLFSVGDVARDRMNQAEVLVGDGLPLEPLVRAVGTPIAILEGRQLRVVHDRGLRANRGLTIVGVDEVQPRLREQLFARDAQRALPCRVQADKVPVEIGDAQQVQRQREEPVQLLFGPLPLDEKANLAADRRQHRQQILVGLADLAAEEFHHPDDLGAADHGEAERRVQPCAIGDRRSGEVRIVDDVGNPGGLEARPHASRQANACRKGGPAADGGELVEWQRRRVPRRGRTEARGRAVDGPERAVLPPERPADGFEHPRRRLHERRRLRERTGRLVDDPLLHAGARLRLVRRRRLHHEHLTGRGRPVLHYALVSGSAHPSRPGGAP